MLKNRKVYQESHWTTKLKNWNFLVKKTKSQKTDLKNGQNRKTKNTTPPSVKCWGLMSQAHVVTASLRVNRWNYIIYLQKCMSFVPYVPWENSFWFKACRTFALIKSYYIIVSFAAACAGVAQCYPPPCAYFKPFCRIQPIKVPLSFSCKKLCQKCAPIILLLLFCSMMAFFRDITLLLYWPHIISCKQH